MDEREDEGGKVAGPRAPRTRVAGTTGCRAALSVAIVLAIGSWQAPAAGQPAEYGSLSGAVTNEAGHPLDRICVRAQTGRSHHQVRTSEDGSYRFPGLEESAYIVSFYDCSEERVYLSEWWDDHREPESADVVQVRGGEETSGIDAALSVGGTITGVVTAPDGSVLPACASAHTTEGWGGSTDYDEGRDGYTIGGLATGSYLVTFFSCGDPPWYESEWYDDAPTQDQATVVTVVEGQVTTGIDAVLEPSPEVDVSVTSLTVQPARLRTDLGDVADSPWIRDVRVVVDHPGAEQAYTFIEATACQQAPVRACRPILWDGFPLEPGTNEFVFEWNGFGMAGDVEIEVVVDASVNDLHPDNDRATARSFVVAGGIPR